MVIEKFTTGLRLHQHPRAQSRQNNAGRRPSDTPAHSLIRAPIIQLHEWKPNKPIAQTDFTKAHLSNAPLHHA